MIDYKSWANYMYLYAIGTAGSKQKIGFSNNPEQRMKSLQTGNPDQLYIHYTMEIPEALATKIESYVHHEHAHRRLKGEWFDMSVDEIISMMTYQEIMLETTIKLIQPSYYIM